MNRLFAWLGAASSVERRTFWACFAGWSVDGFDNQMLSLALPALAASMALSRTESGIIASVTLTTAAIGGWLGGAVSDSIGRVRALQLAILWFAVASLCVALATSYPAVVALKAIQGFGFGAEWVAGVALIAEAIRPEHHGKAMGAVQSGWAVGWGGAILVFGFVASLLPDDLSWRAMFGIGVLPALLVIYIQRRVPEPAKETRAAGFLSALVGIFQRDSLRATLAGGLLGIGAHGGYYGIFTWLPTYLRVERHLSVVSSSGYLAAIIISFGIGCLTSGQLVDWIGRRTTIALFAIGCMTVATVYLVIPAGALATFALGIPLGFCAGGVPAAMGALFSEQYPRGVRGSGMGFCYNFGRLISALFPALIGVLSDRFSLGPSVGVTAVGAYLLVLVALPLLRRNPSDFIVKSGGTFNPV